jgi:hypothetical protein
MPEPNDNFVDLQDVRSAWGKSKTRREETKRKRFMLNGDWHDWLRERVLAQFLEQNAEKLMVRADTTLNLLAWVTQEIAAIYSRPVEREFVTEFEPGVEVDLGLESASHMTFALGECAIRPKWATDRIILDLIPPDRFEYGVSDEDPLDLEWIVIDVTPDGDEKRFRVWTKNNYVTLGPDWKPVDDGVQPNPFGLVPYVVTHTMYPHTCRWQGKKTDIMSELTLFTGVALTDHAHLRHHQSYKQIVIRSDKDAEKQAKIASDPSSVLSVRGQGAGADVLDMQADLIGHLESLLKRLEASLNQWGLRPEIIRGTLDASSGYALKIKLTGQEKAWDKLRRLWDLWEMHLWRLAAKTIPAEGGPVVPKLERIDWPDLGPGKDPTEVANRCSTLVSAGIYSRAEALREMERTDEEIQQIQDEIIQEAALNPQPPPVYGGMPPVEPEDDPESDEVMDAD